MMGEMEFTSRITKEMKDCNAMIYPLIQYSKTEGAHRFGVPKGWPDRYVAHRYYQGFLEFKGAKTRIIQEQRYIISELRNRGVNVYVIREPNIIEGEGTFDSTGLGLLKKLRDLI